MSNKIKSPNEKSNSFLWALLAIGLIAVIVVGYIVFNGKNAKTDNVVNGYTAEKVDFDMEYKDNAITLKSSKANDSTPSVELYEDYSCPHCADLAVATDADMKKAIEAGELVVHIRPLNFLDRGNNDGHSTRADSAALAVAETGNAEDYWNIRGLMMTAQKDIYSKWSLEDFSKAAEKLGIDKDTVQKIADGSERQAAVDLGKANGDKLQADTGTVSSPRVIQNGKDIENIQTWVDQAKAAK